MRKGQITLFAILGVILLFSAGLFLFISSRDGEGSIIESQRSPIENFVLTCLREASEDAIVILGNQGGYIEVPDDIRNNPASFLSFDPKRYSIVPYWYYGGITRIPSLEYMEREIEEYVRKNTLLCLDSFSALDDQYSITTLSNLSITARIADEAVVVEAIYPIEAYDRKNQKSSFERFVASSDVKLRKMHALAKEIMQHENENTFLENITIDLMALDPNIPFSGLEFSCDRKTWSLSSIKRSIQASLYANFPEIRFRNTDYMPFMHPEKDYGKKKGLEDAYAFFHFFILPSKNSYTDLSAGVTYYPEFGLDIAARPASGDVLSAGKTRGPDILRYFCINMYHFTYDLTYPALITVLDKNAFKKRGFAFRFATPVMIDHNAPNRQYVGFQTILPPARFDPDFCSEGGREVTLTAIGSDGVYFGIELPGVKMTYRCFTSECPLGETKNNDGTYSLKANIPSSCSGGTIIAEKDGYVSGEAQLLSDTLEVELTKLKRVKLSFRAQKDTALGTDTPLADDEAVAFVLISDGGKFEKSGYYDRKGEHIIELILDDRTYELDATLMKDGKFIGGFKGNITIRYSDLASASEVELGVVRKSFVPILSSEQEELMQYIYGIAYQSGLKPIFR